MILSHALSVEIDSQKCIEYITLCVIYAYIQGKKCQVTEQSLIMLQEFNLCTSV